MNEKQDQIEGWVRKQISITNSHYTIIQLTTGNAACLKYVAHI